MLIRNSEQWNLFKKLLREVFFKGFSIFIYSLTSVTNIKKSEFQTHHKSCFDDEITHEIHHKVCFRCQTTNTQAFDEFDLPHVSFLSKRFHCSWVKSSFINSLNFSRTLANEYRGFNWICFLSRNSQLMSSTVSKKHKTLIRKKNTLEMFSSGLRVSWLLHMEKDL